MLKGQLQATQLVAIPQEPEAPTPDTTPHAPAAPAPGLLLFPALAAVPVLAHAGASGPAPGSAPPASALTPTSPPTGPPRLGASSPESLVLDTPYCLLDDIRQAAQTHAAAPREKVSLYQFPSYLSTNLRRVLARNRNHRADWSVALACLVWQGLVRYNALPAAQALSALLLGLDTDDALGSLAAEQVEIWRRGCRFAIPDPSHTLGVERCRSFRAPEHVHAELHDLASRLGLSASTLGTVALMSALHDQDGVLGEHGQHMRATVADLDALIEERGRRLRGLIRSIDAGVWR